MKPEKHHPRPRSIWAYGYEISPPLARDRLRRIETLLDDEHSSAKLDARTWEGRFVVEERVTHILIVSDSPHQNLEVNGRLEAELSELASGFSITAPLTVADDAEHPPSTDPPSEAAS